MSNTPANSFSFLFLSVQYCLSEMAAYSDADGRLSESKAKAFAKACAKFSIVGFKVGWTTYFKVVDGKIVLEKMDEEENTVFHEAAKRNLLAPFTFLEFINGDPNPKNKLGVTPLHLASCVQICELLIISLKDRHPRDHNGLTPLHHAALRGQLSVCEVLIRYVENKNPDNHTDGTPLLML